MNGSWQLRRVVYTDEVVAFAHVGQEMLIDVIPLVEVIGIEAMDGRNAQKPANYGKLQLAIRQATEEEIASFLEENEDVGLENCQLLKITVIKAENITNTDMGFSFANMFAGKSNVLNVSDPDVEVIIGQTSHKTQVVSDSLSPVWDETFFFPVSKQDVTIEVILWDFDSSKKSQKLGKFTLPIDQFKSANNLDWYSPLLPGAPRCCSSWRLGAPRCWALSAPHCRVLLALAPPRGWVLLPAPRGDYTQRRGAGQPVCAYACMYARMTHTHTHTI